MGGEEALHYCSSSSWAARCHCGAGGGGRQGAVLLRVPRTAWEALNYRQNRMLPRHQGHGVGVSTGSASSSGRDESATFTSGSVGSAFAPPRRRSEVCHSAFAAGWVGFALVPRWVIRARGRGAQGEGSRPSRKATGERKMGVRPRSRPACCAGVWRSGPGGCGLLVF